VAHPGTNIYMRQKPHWRGLSERGTQQTVKSTSQSSPSMSSGQLAQRQRIGQTTFPAGAPVSHDCRSLAVQRAWTQLQSPKQNRSKGIIIQHTLQHIAAQASTASTASPVSSPHRRPLAPQARPHQQRQRLHRDSNGRCRNSNSQRVYYYYFCFHNSSFYPPLITLIL
jgi:hypothetical protein